VRVARVPPAERLRAPRLPFLEGDAQPHLTMCGRDSGAKFTERRATRFSRRWAAASQRTVAEVARMVFCCSFRVPPYEMTVFSDGRAIIKGTRDTSVARSLYARYIGT